MELASIKVELDRANEENNKQLALVLEALRDENNSNLIDAAKGAIKKTVSTKQDKVKDDLIKKFKLYQEPLMSVQEWYGIMSKKNKEANEKQIQKEEERNLATYYEEVINRECPRVIHLPVNDAMPAGYTYVRDPTARPINPSLQGETPLYENPRQVAARGERTIPYCPYTGEALYGFTLRYNYEVEFTPFVQSLRYHPLTEVLRLDETLTQLLKKSEYLGLDKNQFIEVIKLLIQKHMPDYLFMVQDNEDNAEVFKIVVDLINTGTVLYYIKDALASFKRTRDLNIRVCHSRYKSLVVTKLECQQPNLSPSQILVKATRQALIVVTSLVSPETKRAFDKWARVRRASGEDLNEKEILDHLEKLEASNPEMRLTEDIVLANNNDQIALDQISLFFNDIGEEEIDTLATEYSDTRFSQRIRDKSSKKMNSGPAQGQPRGGGGGRGGGRGSGGRGRGKGAKNKGRGSQSKSQSRQPKDDNRPAPGAHQSRKENHQNNDNRRKPTPHPGADRSRSRSAQPGHKKNNDRDKSQNRSRSQSNNNRGRGGSNRGRGGSSRGRGKGKQNNDHSDKKNHGHCEKCMSPLHSNQDCPAYDKLMQGSCRRCNLGRHKSQDCKLAIRDF